MIISIIAFAVLILFVITTCIGAVWLNLFDREDKDNEGE